MSKEETLVKLKQKYDYFAVAYNLDLLKLKKEERLPITEALTNVMYDIKVLIGELDRTDTVCSDLQRRINRVL